MMGEEPHGQEKLPSSTETAGREQGDAAEGDKKQCCGPDVTDWFYDELILHWNYSVTQYNNHGWWRFHAPSSYTDFATYANSLNYKFMAFAGQTCPVNCPGTVTCCNTCLHKSELGNLMFGITGRLWGFYYFQLRLGTWIKGAGLRSAWDRAAAEAGYDSATNNATALTASAASMCQTLRAHPQWANIQDPIAVPCPICTEVYTGPHSTPGLPCVFPA